MSHYISYYNDQVGGGVKNVFAGSTYQRGSGIGSFLGSIFRHIAPFLTSGAKAVGKEAVRAGLNVLDDVANHGTNFKESLKTRAQESGYKLRRKAADKISDIMRGNGYKTGRVKRRRQSKTNRASVRNKTKKRSRKRNKTIKNTVRRRRVKRKPATRSVSDIFGPK